MNEEYSETEWIKDKRKIKQNIKTFENTKKLLKDKVDEAKYNNKENSNINMIDDYLQEVEKEIVPLINRINERTKYYSEVEIENEQQNSLNQPQGEILIQDLQSNKELLEERGKQLATIYETSSKMKDISDSMAKQLNEQGAILDDVEANVVTAEENAKKAKEEIGKADELSKGNRKKMFCIIGIVLVAVVVISLIILSLII